MSSTPKHRDQDEGLWEQRLRESMACSKSCDERGTEEEEEGSARGHVGATVIRNWFILSPIPSPPFLAFTSLTSNYVSAHISLLFRTKAPRSSILPAGQARMEQGAKGNEEAKI